MSSPPGPEDRSWVVALYGIGSDRPIGAGVVIDATRILTCRHVVGSRLPTDLEVAFPWALDPFGSPLPVVDIRVADHPRTDVAVVELGQPLPSGVRPARLRRPEGSALVDQRWWAYGFSDHTGNDAWGDVGADQGYGWVRVDGGSRYSVEPGFSGGGLWSPHYGAVVALVGQRHGTGDGRCFTLSAAVKVLPEEKLAELIDGYDVLAAGQDAVRSWGWSLDRDVEGRRHWRPRARGVTTDTERGYRFSGRRVALTQIVDWLARDVLDHTLLVITGSPGVGKSAVIARLVTTADAGVAAQLPRNDDAVRAPIGSIACAVHAKAKTALEVAKEIAAAASAPLPERIADAVPLLREGLLGREGRRFTVVIDALDEASSPEEARKIVRHLLLPLAETCADVGVQIVVGTRRRDEDGDLIGTFGPGRQEIDLDLPGYFAEDDLLAYAMASLQLRGAERVDTPYADSSSAMPVAERISAVSTPNFLVAGLIGRTHGLHDERAVDPAEIQLIPQAKDPVAVAFSGYLARIGGVGRLTATEALTALAYAEAPGLNIELWRVAAEAITGQTVDDSELAVFVSGAAANFLVDSSDGGTVHRLFHQALNDTLVAERLRRSNPASDQLSITEAFLRLGNARGWDRVPAYLLRSLTHHATSAAALEAVLDDPVLLLHTDLRRLIPAATAARTPAGRDRARLLRRTPQAIKATPSERHALYSLTETLDNLGTTFRDLPGDIPYRGRWAQAMAGGEVAILEGHSRQVHGACAVRVDGQDLLASAGADATIRVWDPSTGESIRILRGHSRPVHGVCAVRVNGQDLLASASNDTTVKIWDPSTGRTVHTLKGHNRAVNGVCAVHVEGQDLLASAGNDATVRIWDPSTGDAIHTLEGHTGWVNAVCSIRVGGKDLLASTANDANVRVWNPSTGASVHTMRGHGDLVRGLCAVRVHGKDLLASAANDSTVRIWDPTAGRVVRILKGHNRPVNAVCAIRVGDWDLLASAGTDGTVRVWDPSTGRAVRTFEGHSALVLGVCAVPVGNQDLLASAGSDATIRIWDPSTDPRIHPLKGHNRPVNGVCAVRIAGQDLLVSAGADATIQILDPSTDKTIQILKGHNGTVNGVCAIRVGGRDLLASAGTDAVVRIWDPSTGKAIHSLTDHTGQVLGLCAIQVAEGHLLASAGNDAVVRIWDPATGRAVHTLHGHSRPVNGLCQIRVGDRGLLASASNDATVRIWDPITGQAIHTLKDHTGQVHSVCAIRVGDRDLLASAGNGAVVQIWDPSTGQAIHTLKGHRGPVHGVCAVGVAGRELLASTGNDRTVHIWDIAQEHPMAVIPTRSIGLGLTSDRDGGLGVTLELGLLMLDISGLGRV